MNFLQGKSRLVIFTALTIGITVFLIAGFASAKDWRKRSLWTRPEKPSVQTRNNIPSDRSDASNMAGENQAKDRNNPGIANKHPKKSEKISQPAASTQQPSPLMPEFDEDFKKARKLSVAKYLKKYGQYGEDHDYRIGGEDMIDISVYDEPELDRKDLRVSADGYVTLPLIRRVKLVGLTTAKAEKLIRDKYSNEGYLKNPHVTVNIKQFKSRRVMIMGAVNQPGRHSMEGNERLLEMLAKAGGIKFDAEGDVAANKIRILRTIKTPRGKTERINMEMDLESLTQGSSPEYNIVMQDNDVVYVPESPRFFVTGEVKNPGYYKIKDRPISVIEAITMAGGPTRTAALNRTRVVRTTDGKETTLDIPADDILDGDKNKDIIVKPNDVIVIPQSYF